ncbi:unnamed protein product [Caenorhabditis auriculariae]|uniref:EGF-like domain-containing protein n=1 Tax=Caenorhabditis auriculariae TaxID=2777116 RepID=A0A8S1GY80_9PELO|nr:unnamed protein product [Caenorhabditis auriculariae]
MRAAGGGHSARRLHIFSSGSPLLLSTILLFILFVMPVAAISKNFVNVSMPEMRPTFVVNFDTATVICQHSADPSDLHIHNMSSLCDGNQDCYHNPAMHDESFPYCERKCDSTCGGKGACLYDGNRAMCYCDSGFSGPSCEVQDANECLERPCHLMAHCQNTMGSYECRCLSGFSGDGHSCVDVDECVDSKCPDHAECINLPGTFFCNCTQGFSPKGQPLERCADINECDLKLHDCKPHQICENTLGSFKCVDSCSVGYESNDDRDSEAVGGCVDVDECSRGTHSCDPRADCTNTVGGYTCECDEGFTGDGKNCQPVTDCNLNGDICDRHAHCLPGMNMCLCNAGYVGDGITCHDVNECEANVNTCSSEARCVNIEGGYICCGAETDDDRCIEQQGAFCSGGCGLNALCLNSSCACIDGFSGDPRRKCLDVNECEDEKKCGGVGEWCVNLSGGFTCCNADSKNPECLVLKSTDVAAQQKLSSEAAVTHSSVLSALGGELIEGSGQSHTSSGGSVAVARGTFTPSVQLISSTRLPCTSYCPANSDCVKGFCECSKGYGGNAYSGCEDVDECLTGKQCKEEAGEWCVNLVGSFVCCSMDNATHEDCIGLEITRGNGLRLIGGVEEGAIVAASANRSSGDELITEIVQQSRNFSSGQIIVARSKVSSGEALLQTTPSDEFGLEIVADRVTATPSSHTTTDSSDADMLQPEGSGSESGVTGASPSANSTLLVRFTTLENAAGNSTFSSTASSILIESHSSGNNSRVAEFESKGGRSSSSEGGIILIGDGKHKKEEPDSGEDSNEVGLEIVWTNSSEIVGNTNGTVDTDKVGLEVSGESLSSTTTTTELPLILTADKTTTVVTGRIIGIEETSTAATSTPLSNATIGSTQTTPTVDVEEWESLTKNASKGILTSTEQTTPAIANASIVPPESSSSPTFKPNETTDGFTPILHSNQTFSGSSTLPSALTTSAPENETGPGTVSFTEGPPETSSEATSTEKVLSTSVTKTSETSETPTTPVPNLESTSTSSLSTTSEVAPISSSPASIGSSSLPPSSTTTTESLASSSETSILPTAATEASGLSSESESTSTSIGETESTTSYLSTLPSESSLSSSSTTVAFEKTTKSDTLSESTTVTPSELSTSSTSEGLESSEPTTSSASTTRSLPTESRSPSVPASSTTPLPKSVSSPKTITSEGEGLPLVRTTSPNETEAEKKEEVTSTTLSSSTSSVASSTSQPEIDEIEGSSEVISPAEPTETTLLLSTSSLTTSATLLPETTESSFSGSSTMTVKITPESTTSSTLEHSTEKQKEITSTTLPTSLFPDLGETTAKKVGDREQVTETPTTSAKPEPTEEGPTTVTRLPSKAPTAVPQEPTKDTFSLATTSTAAPSNVSLVEKTKCTSSDECGKDSLCERRTGVCRCLPGFEGTPPHTPCADVDECARGLHKCHESSRCHNYVGGYTCFCPVGFRKNEYGICEDVNECEEWHSTCCGSNSTCVNSPGSYSCSCNQGFIGDGYHCVPNRMTPCNAEEQIRADCSSNRMCMVNGDGSFDCSTCLTGFELVEAECKDINECDSSHMCHSKAVCSNLNGSYSCACVEGFRGDGFMCEDVDECERRPCHPNAECTNSEGSFACKCAEGFTGDGVKECMNPLEKSCEDVEKFCGRTTNVVCLSVRIYNDSLTSVCECDPNYRFDEKTRQCVDIDECMEDRHNCDPASSVCVNEDGGFRCDCAEGYEGKGGMCVVLNICISCAWPDIDECGRGMAGCDSMATCINRMGSCGCKCMAGYTGDGTQCFEMKKPETSTRCTEEWERLCEVENKGCHVDEEDVPQCGACLAGHQPVNGTCQPVQGVGLCKEKNDCDVHADCIDVHPGSHFCVCSPGFIGDGKICDDIDECSLHGMCDENAVCKNSMGAFECVCKDGFRREGRVCVAQPVWRRSQQKRRSHVYRLFFVYDNNDNYEVSCSTEVFFDDVFLFADVSFFVDAFLISDVSFFADVFLFSDVSFFADVFLISDVSFFTDVFLISDVSFFADVFLFSDVFFFVDVPFFADVFLFTDVSLFSGVSFIIDVSLFSGVFLFTDIVNHRVYYNFTTNHKLTKNLFDVADRRDQYERCEFNSGKRLQSQSLDVIFVGNVFHLFFNFSFTKDFWNDVKDDFRRRTREPRHDFSRNHSKSSDRDFRNNQKLFCSRIECFF